MVLSNAEAIVVHYRSYETVAETVSALLAEGFTTDTLTVVDTSEEPARRQELAEMLPSGTSVLFTSNGGYGAAINHALDHLKRVRAELPAYTLVATHEVMPAAGDIQRLIDALENEPSAAAAGPTLVTGDDGAQIWSEGGTFSGRYSLPAHESFGEYRAPTMDGQPQSREWLDGAFVLYRSVPLDELRFDESFFLYMEETDLHLRLKRAGHGLLWVPGTSVWQSSGGVPPFYFARNLRLLFQKHPERFTSKIAVPAAVARRALSLGLKKRDVNGIVQLVRGLNARVASPEAEPHVIVLNPLGGTLLHYEEALASVLRAGGARVERLRVFEPSAGGGSKLDWVRNYIRALVSARRRSAAATNVVVLWPVLGYLDVILIRAIAGSRSRLIMHDPEPLVHAVGYDRMSRGLAGLFARSFTLVSHSSAASSAIEASGWHGSVETLPHPIFDPTPAAPRAGGKPIVSVLGQYKKDRDLAALEEIAEGMAGEAELNIHGRGWPDVPGWRVDARFISEKEMDDVIAESAAVVIPYKRFFQSGVAFRALESAVPVVGVNGSSLDDLFGSDSGLLVSPGQKWSDAVQVAIRSGRSQAEAAARSWRARCVEAWRKGLAS
jgi:GT2 family glycosyltransferase